MAAPRLIWAAAVAATAAAPAPPLSREGAASDGSADINGGDTAQTYITAAGSIVVVVVVGMCVGCVTAWLGRGGGRGAGAAGAVPRVEPTVLGLPLGRELFDALFSPVAIQDELVCVVCLLPTGRDEPCRRLHCGHGFHPECIDGWWMQTKDATLRCPVCRRTQAPRAAEVSI